MVHAPKIDPNNKDKKGQNNEEQGFFCSELVATFYKDLGIITRDTKNANYLPACNFYPKDFSVKSGRKMDVGDLSPEYDIYFDKALLKANYKGMKF